MAGVDSGIKIHPTTTKKIEELQKSSDKDLVALIMRIGVPPEGGKPAVLVEKEMTKADCDAEADGVQLKNEETSIWYAFRKNLTAHDIAYGAAYIHYTSSDGRPNSNKLVFVTWNTDSAKMKEKMVYSSTKVFSKMQSGTINHQASDEDDISYLEIVDRKIGRK